MIRFAGGRRMKKISTRSFSTTKGNVKEGEPKPTAMNVLRSMIDDARKSFSVRVASKPARKKIGWHFHIVNFLFALIPAAIVFTYGNEERK